MKNSRASSASFKSVPNSSHQLAEESFKLGKIDPEFVSQHKSTIRACSIAKVTDQAARPKDCGYHEAFVFSNGDR